MSRKRYRQICIDGVWTLIDTDDLIDVRDHNAPTVWGDIKPYRSMVTGEEISSRSRHREHLKQHRMIEIGNETKYLRSEAPKPPPGLKQTIIDVVNSKL